MELPGMARGPHLDYRDTSILLPRNYLCLVPSKSMFYNIIHTTKLFRRSFFPVGRPTAVVVESDVA
jgi:hypothetical protein